MDQTSVGTRFIASAIYRPHRHPMNCGRDKSGPYRKHNRMKCFNPIIASVDSSNLLELVHLACALAREHCLSGRGARKVTSLPDWVGRIRKGAGPGGNIKADAQYLFSVRRDRTCSIRSAMRRTGIFLTYMPGTWKRRYRSGLSRSILSTFVRG